MANVAAQVISTGLFVRALIVEGALRRPDPATMRAQLGVGRDLMLRSLAFQAVNISATAVAAHTAAATVGAHQIVLQLWVFLVLVLDSLAIAAQSLIGAALGAHDDRGAIDVARRVTGFGLVFGAALTVLFAALYWVLPRVFTSDATVLAEIPKAWWFFVALQPVCGVVFALDGVLLGAGDAVGIRNVTLISAGCGFLPVVWASLFFDWGLVGIWCAMSAFMLLRLVFVVNRWRSGAWAVLGAELKSERDSKTPTSDGR
jgi:putative MATE family efflux protein